YRGVNCCLSRSLGESLESKERIHVCLRVKPILELEKEHDTQGCVSVVDSTSIILKAPKGSKTFRLSEKNLRQLVQKYTFSQVFGPKTTQEELFDGAVKQPMLDFLKGHSRLIFTYGVTNAGKTHTYLGTDEDKGILPRSLDMLFQSIENKLYPDMNLKPHRCRDYRNLSKEEVREEISLKNSLLRLLKEKEPEKEADQSDFEDQSGVKFSVWVSFFEIYNECIYDLLLPISNDKKRKMLRLALDIKEYSYVKDLQWIQVSNSKEAYKLMKVGLRHQSYGSTKLNANSSRSHSIFTVKMLKIDSETMRVLQVNELFLCDLAGSERCTRTCNKGERLKESGNINTSLLILGKCIGALKSNQQTKLQQHIPFRESKLTHFFQGFFSGKGKVCMIVNVSQSPSAYDETLNVLKFSAIAQKVNVVDQVSSIKTESESILDDGMRLPTKRATIFWEGTLEDVMEDEEELVEDGNEEHQGDCLTESQLEGEDSDIIIKKEEYQKLLYIIDELKNKLIEEKKAKLYTELKIRKEVTQECFQYFCAKESDLNDKEEIMATTCEERMIIYKDLVKDCIALPDGQGGAEETLKEGEKAAKPGSVADLPSMVGSLQQNVADIKQQAEMAFNMLDALEEPQLTIERLEKQLADVTAELAHTREDLCSKNKGTQREITIATIKQQIEQENCSESKEKNIGSRRKRYLERDEEGPPSKQGITSSSAYTERLNKMLEVQVASLKEKLEKEKNEKEGFSSEIARLSQALSSEKERVSGLKRELQQQQIIQEQATLELAMLKERNKGHEEKIRILLQEIGAASQITVEEKSQVKTLEAELGLLNRLGSACPMVDVVLANQENISRDKLLPTPVNADEKSSFHRSIEGIWKISQEIINASSQKSSSIADLMQQVEQLRMKTSEADEENSQLKLKLRETISQRDAFVQEKTSLLNQLRDLEQKNTFYVEKYKEEENRAVEKIKTNEDLLEECRAKDVRIVSLEQIVKDKESAILVMKQSIQDMEEKLGISEAKIGKFMDQESQLRVEVVDLKRLNEVGREKLKEELSKSTDLSSRLQAEIQQKDEEFADLKEKLADSKKQIEQVQRQVGSMRAEEKLLRSKVNELEKAKGQLTEELDLKQRTIQQFKKDNLSKKLEDLLQQYQNSCEDVLCKEKIIDDMRLTLEEQERTQYEQDQILQATLAENERCKAYFEGFGMREWRFSHFSGFVCRAFSECEEQHETDRRKWLAEKTHLITQAKVAETLRNKEMKKFPQLEVLGLQSLSETEKRAAEKDNELQRWRVERDQLVAALEVQLSSLISSNVQKDKEMEELKKMVPQSSGKEGRKEDYNESEGGSEGSFALVLGHHRDQPDTVLDSYEGDQISRFPKPELEIQFSPLQPTKLEVKHQGSPSTVTLKVPRTRKRKSCTMDEDSLKNENEKNIKLPIAPPNPTLRKNYSLRNKYSSNIQSMASPGGTLYKFGNLLQNSPTIIQTKAKKLMATMKSPKSTDEEAVKKNDDKPKKAKRKLHSTNISAPVEFSGPAVRFHKAF
uniref:Kinesin family member 20B n=1 Tax=Pseudonaja textilis TaxID=8673 RepID=A0A670ZJB0_PSETE